MTPTHLELNRATRALGTGSTPRNYLDFVFDGLPLSTRLKAGDWITGIGWMPPDAEQLYIDRLLLRASPDSPTGRISIYICPECGDLGCGAFTAHIARTDDGFLWSEFAFENNYEYAPLDLYPNVGPFLFNKTHYWQELTTRGQSR